MRKQQGISLLELVLGLAILSIILISGMRYFYVARESSRVNQSLTMIKAVYTAAEVWRSKGLKFSDNAYEGVESDSLLRKFSQLGLLPSEYDQEVKQNPWGGEFKAQALDQDQLKILLMRIPNTACAAISSKMTDLSSKEVSCTGHSAAADLTIIMNIQ